MEDICCSVGAMVAEHLVPLAIRHARYLFCFNKLVGCLRTEKQNLISTQKSVQERVDEAIKKTEIICATVEEWLKAVEDLLKRVQQLEKKIEASQSCFSGSCRYSLAKEVVNVTQEITELKVNSKFDPFSRLAELPRMTYFSSKDFVPFRSAEVAYNELWKALGDENIYLIGVHGMGGSGKTTLVKEVGKKAQGSRLFDMVVFAVVSRTPSFRNIQDQIADQLGLRLGEQSDNGRAQRLSVRLETGSTLIILDDAWKKPDFEAIGIPSNNNSKSCKVLITTRNRRVCDSMDCKTIIKLSLLDEDEAWNLFKMRAGITDDSPAKLKNVARNIAGECKGLPIAIVTVGSTLKGKTPEEWQSALLRLKNSQPMDTEDIEQDLRNPYRCLKLSYDNLINPVAKSLFLLCSMFPEDFEINKEDLVRYGKGLQVSGVTAGSMERARAEMAKAVNILIDSCLLISDKKACVKMHDVVRDVALWIASQECKAIMVYTGNDSEPLVEDETVKDKAAIVSLWNLQNGQILDELLCPTLKLLLLHSKDVGFGEASFLEGIKLLEVLTLMRFSYSWHSYQWGTIWALPLSMPESVESLRNLRSLCLRGYKFTDISFLGGLTMLEILDLRGSSFNELPTAIVALKKLKLVDLYKCSIKEGDPYEVLEKCLQLEELYIWMTAYHSQKIVSFPKLKRYVVGHAKGEVFDPFLSFLEERGISRAFCIGAFLSATSYATSAIEHLAKAAEFLYLLRLKGGYKNVIPTMDQQGMNQLIHLELEFCSEIECLVDLNRYTNPDVNLVKDVFSELVSLRLHHMNRLLEVFRDSSSLCSLKNLEEMEIKSCERLFSISFPKNSNLCSLKILVLDSCPILMGSLFTWSLAQTLERLEEMRIKDCTNLKHIVAEDEREGNIDGVSNQQIHSLTVLPKLRILDVEGFGPYSIFHVSFTQGPKRVEEIETNGIRRLKYVFVRDQNRLEINLPGLRRSNLVSMRTPNSNELAIINCPMPEIDSDMQQDNTTK